MLKLKYPGKSVLRTVEIEYVDRYVEWLYGPEVLGEAALDDHDRPISTATIGQVISYDHRMREEVAKFMNVGHDFSAAFDKPRTDEKLRTRYFTRPVSVSINTAECRACSAPNIKGHGGLSASRAQPYQEAAVSKSQLNRIKQQAKAEAERDVKRKYNLLALTDAPAGQLSARAKKKARQQANRHLALQNGGVGDGSDGGFPRLQTVAPPPNAHPAARPGKGAGKDRRDSFNGKPICYNWNKGAPCKQNPCPMAHVCLICNKEHRKKDHPGSGM